MEIINDDQIILLPTAQGGARLSNYRSRVVHHCEVILSYVYDSFEGHTIKMSWLLKVIHIQLGSTLKKKNSHLTILSLLHKLNH